jgi:hypothetical protein
MRPTASTAVILRFPGHNPRIIIYDRKVLLNGEPASAHIAQAWLDEQEVITPGGWGPSGMWEMQTSEAHPGWGPLLYDVAATGFGVTLVPSNILSRHAKRFWDNQFYRTGRRQIRPLSDQAFSLKYGVTLDGLVNREGTDDFRQLMWSRGHFRARRRNYS